MGMLSVEHPDIMDFITAKHGTESILTNFNISVKVPNHFMQSASRNWDIWNANDTWNAIVEGAWENGEPGIYFEDTVNNERLHPELIHATNPCGEVPLRPYEACVLGSVNLAAHMVERDGRYFLDEQAYRDTIDTMTILLDNVIELQHYPIPVIEREQKRYRKIGVGVMGFADALCLMGSTYGDDRSYAAAREWGRILKEQSYETSARLGVERGGYRGFVTYNQQVSEQRPNPWDFPFRRNLNCQVIAPTGSISRLAECSFGIEPHFDVDENGKFMSFVVGGAFEDDQPYADHPCFTPASMVRLEQHIKMQAAWQENVDQAVSKTVNCPNSTTKQEVSDALILAWETGCKGVTLLREGSRENVVIGATSGDCNGAACAI
jgi:ribonucleoside-diphosphate reductase alpha chain